MNFYYKSLNFYKVKGLKLSSVGRAQWKPIGFGLRCLKFHLRFIVVLK